jgi:very-short-patch-repair endonuclease
MPAAAARAGGILCLTSAALFWGWKVKTEPQRHHVHVPRGRKVAAERRGGTELHRYAMLAGEVEAGLATSRVQTVVDCARFLPFDEALSVADSALREGCVTRAQLFAALDSGTSRRSASARRVLAHADARADNPFESCLRAICLDVPGLSVEPQVELPGIGRADLVDRELRLVVEAESLAFHNSEQSFRRDIRRYTAMVRAQWRVLRFVWEDVMFRQDYVREVLLDLVVGGRPHFPQLIVPRSDRRL